MRNKAASAYVFATFSKGRWQRAAVRVSTSSTVLHVITIYGFPRANEGGEAMENNEAFLSKVFLEARSFRKRRRVNLWRFQCRKALQGSGWTPRSLSLEYLKFQLIQLLTGNTQSRIDMAFLSPTAARLMKDVRVIPVPEGGMKLHRPLEVTLEFAGSTDVAFVTRKIRGLPAPVNTMTKEDEQHLENEVFERLTRAVCEAWDEGNVDKLREKW